MHNKRCIINKSKIYLTVFIILWVFLEPLQTMHRRRGTPGRLLPTLEYTIKNNASRFFETMSESTNIALTEIGQRIRQIDKKILSIKRERAAVLSRPGSPNKISNPSSRPTTAATNATNTSEAPPTASNIADDEDSAAIDPILELETEREKQMAKYEQLNDGNSFKPSLENQIFDFCEGLYREIERPGKDFNWISKYYSADAHMNIVGLGSFSGRDQAVRAVIVSTVTC